MWFLDGMGIIFTHKKALATCMKFSKKELWSILLDAAFFFSIAPLFYLWAGVMFTRIQKVATIDLFGVHELNMAAMVDAQSKLFGFLVFVVVSLIIFFLLGLFIYALTHYAKWNIIFKKKFSKQQFKLFYLVSLVNLLPWFILFIGLFVYLGEIGAIIFAFLYIIGGYFHSIGKLSVYHHRTVWKVIKEQYVLGFTKLPTFIVAFFLVGIIYYIIFTLLGMLLSIQMVTLIIMVVYGFMALVVRKYFGKVYELTR